MYFGLMKENTEMQKEKQEAASGAGRLSERRFWQAVASRDTRYDGAFVYAVRSTGVYCRPSCPSRRPRRERVVFFGAPEAAEHQAFDTVKQVAELIAGRVPPNAVNAQAAHRLSRLKRG